MAFQARLNESRLAIHGEICMSEEIVLVVNGKSHVIQAGQAIGL
jgi:hypothetical protein